MLVTPITGGLKVTLTVLNIGSKVAVIQAGVITSRVMAIGLPTA